MFLNFDLALAGGLSITIADALTCIDPSQHKLWFLWKHKAYGQEISVFLFSSMGTTTFRPDFFIKTLAGYDSDCNLSEKIYNDISRKQAKIIHLGRSNLLF